MMSELATALDDAEALPEARVAVITGHGMRVFSAGGEITDHSRERVGESIDDFSRLLRKLQNFSLSTIAALNGATLGGGHELAVACDMIVSVPDAKIWTPGN